MEDNKNSNVKSKKNKKKKNIIPGLKNDDLFMIILGIIMVLFVFNMPRIYKLINEPKFDNKNEENNNNENKENEKEQVLSCISLSNYYPLYDVDYLINYKKQVYKVTYGIKFKDETKLETDQEKNELNNQKQLFANYIANFENVQGVQFTTFENNNFIQIIDLTKISKDIINGFKEQVIPFEINDNLTNIKTKLENSGFTCE